MLFMQHYGKVRQTTLSELETNPRLSFFRHGLDEDLATLLDSMQSMGSTPPRSQKYKMRNIN